MVVIIWVGSAILIQMIFSSEESQFAKPLFLTYFSTSWFTLYLIPLVYRLIKYKIQAKGAPSTGHEKLDSSRDEIQTGPSSDEGRIPNESTKLDKASEARRELELTKSQVKRVLPISLTFCLLWFLANYSYNFGLLYASITSSVVLANTHLEKQNVWLKSLSLFELSVLKPCSCVYMRAILWTNL